MRGIEKFMRDAIRDYRYCTNYTVRLAHEADMMREPVPYNDARIANSNVWNASYNRRMLNDEYVASWQQYLRMYDRIYVSISTGFVRGVPHALQRRYLQCIRSARMYARG